MNDKDSLSDNKPQKTDFSKKIKSEDLPLNHKELARLDGPPLQWSEQRNIYIFRRHGQSLICLIYPPTGYSIRTQLLYPAETEDGQKVLLHGNKHLQRLIKKFDLIGKWVKIVYRQDIWGRGGHKTKIYAVYDLTEKMKRGDFSPAIKKIMSEIQHKKTG